MTEATQAPAGSDADDRGGDDGTANPLPLRALGWLGLVALLVALYAIVQLTSGDDSDQASGVVVPTGPGDDVLPLGSGESPKPGAEAPDFTVPTLEGGTFSLSGHLAEDGRPVFLNMWAEWCFPCRTEMPAIDALSRRHPEVHFIGVVVRDKESPARRFVEEYEITYQIGLDVDHRVERDYFVWAMPSTYLIGSDGRIIERVFGPMTEDKLEELIALVAS